MSLVTDTQSIVVDGAPAVPVQLNVTTVEIVTTLAVPEVTLDVPNATQTVEVAIPGAQGAPGVKNVYIQSNNPAVQYGWGAAETNYVWIPTP